MKSSLKSFTITVAIIIILVFSGPNNTYAPVSSIGVAFGYGSSGGGGGYTAGSSTSSIQKTFTITVPFFLDTGTSSYDDSLITTIRANNLYASEFNTGTNLNVVGALAALGNFAIPQGAIDSVNELSHPNDVQDTPTEENQYKAVADGVLKKFPDGAPKVIVARGDDGADSLAAVAYANVLGLPIILTRPNELPSETSNALSLLQTTSITILGGSTAVSESVAGALPSPERIAGSDRFETSVLIAEKLLEETAVDTLIITDGFNPDPSSAFEAVTAKAPILFTDGDKLPDATMNFIVENKQKFKEIKMLGVSDNVRSVIEAL